MNKKVVKPIDWRMLSKREAFKWVKAGLIENDLFEDFFQITERDLEELKNG